MKSNLSDLCFYVKDKIEVNLLNEKTYISTENMLPEKSGITAISSLPKVKKTQKFKKGDVLVSNIRPYLKKIWLANFEGGCSNDVLILRAKDGICPRFLYYVLADDGFFDYSTTTAKGTKMPRGDKTAIMNYKVPQFPYAYQEKIANLLGLLDSKIELNNMISHNLEEQAQVLFKSWFVNYDPFNGEKPDTWEQVPFSSFLTERKEKSDDPTLPLFSVTDNGIFPREKKFKKKLSKAGTKNKVLYNTDLVFGMSRKILNWGIMREPMGGVSSAYNVFAVNERINSKYFESYIKAHQQQFNDLIRPASREGQGIDKAVLMNKTITIPPAQILEEYYQLEDSLTAMIDCVQEQSQALAVIRDTLLPKLMSGELDVSDLDL